ncbi:MAG TPA: hypothetical protein VK492_18235 [Chitinophagaceae bacterium]|nr:hypothetical protein [Chitinophagaceae bacterium]
MKFSFLLFVIVISLVSCKKEIEPVSLRPIPEEEVRILSSDTLKTGQKWGFSIGDSTADMYFRMQNNRAEYPMNVFTIVGNIFTRVADLENRLTLYSGIYLDQTIGSPNGIQIAFSNNKIKSIFTNNGTQLSRWPINEDPNSSIAVDDSIDGLYSKLVNISHINAYKSYLERISLFFKDLNKDFDPHIILSPQWIYVRIVDSRMFYVIELNFVSGRLASIYSTLYENS